MPVALEFVLLNAEGLFTSWSERLVGVVTPMETDVLTAGGAAGAVAAAAEVTV